MPISSQTPIIGYVANGVSTAFTFPFVILSADDLKVSVNNALVTTGLSITGVGDRDGGTVTFSAPPAASAPIILYREVSLERTTDYQENGDLLASVLDDDLDRLWAALQDQAVIGSQALRVPVGETVSALPKASERALKALGFNSLGQPIALPRVDEAGNSLALDLLDTAPGKGADLVGANDGAGGSLFSTVAGFFNRLKSSAGALLVGYGTGTVKDTLDAHSAQLANVEGNLNFTTLPAATTPVSSADLLILRQGGANKKVEIGEIIDDAVAASVLAVAPSVEQAEYASASAQAARDAAFVNATVYASISAGLAATTDGQQFQVVSGSEIIRYVRASSTVANEVARYPAKSFVDSLSLFPTRTGWTPAETGALPRILALQLFGTNAQKQYFVKYHFWKDAGTRYNLTIQAADDAIGTNAVDVAQYVVASGADVWDTVREVSLGAMGGSGVTGTALVDFTSSTAMTANLAPSDASTFQRRRLSPTVSQIGAARANNITSIAATGLNIRNRAAQISAFAGGTAGNDTQTGLRNTGFGYASSDSLAAGTDNTGFGYNTLTATTSGNYSSAFGSGALQAANSDSNCAFGYYAASSLTSGGSNNAFGFQAGYALTTGVSNAALGHRALFTATAGSYNVALGNSALQSYTGSGATAVGSDAATSLTTATNFTAIGRRAAYNKTTGADCTYVGFQAGWSGIVKTDTGDGNTAVGAYALGHNETGSYNTGCGRASGWYGKDASRNSWLGYRVGYGVASGNDNIGIGFYTLHNLNVSSRNIAIGSYADAYIPVSDSMTATVVAGAGLSIGAYTYRVSFVLDGVETALSELPKNATTTAGNQQVNLASIPTYTGPRTCSARHIYRTPVGGENLYYRVGTLADNTTTTFSDTTPDASLTTRPDSISDSIAIGVQARFMKSGQMVVGSVQSRITEVYMGGGVDDTSPNALTYSSSNASGTNVAGADLRLRAGTSTGSGQPGQVILAAAAPGSSGTTHNATVDWVALDGRGFLNIKETAAASVPTPAAGSINLFVEGGALKFRDSSGSVKTLTAA